MRLSLLVLLIAACGHGPSNTPPDGSLPEADASAGSADAAIDAPPACDMGLTRCGSDCVDTSTSSSDCGQCGSACDPSATCTAGACKSGHPAAATGTCTYIDQPGWLSCPTGMSCQCYYHYDRLFQDQPAMLATWVSDATIEITGGTLPANQTLYSVPAATIARPSGNAYPYQLTTGAMGALQITIYATSDYVPASDVLYSDADCGNEGKILQCTFAM